MTDNTNKEYRKITNPDHTIDMSKVSDDFVISLVSNKLRERVQKIKEYEIVFQELKVMNKKLIKSEENKSRFLSLIRNEFNNPLFAVIPLLKDLYNTKKDETIKVIYIEMLKLNLQLGNIVSASEIENGVLEKNLTLFDFSALIKDVQDSIEMIYSEKNITLQIDLAEEVKEIVNDRDKVNQVLYNLIDNAFNYSKNDSKVLLKIFMKDNLLNLSIENEGEVIGKISVFDSFEEENIYSSEKKGLGLGLTIVKTYTEFLTGSLDISRDSIKGFNTVKVIVPFYENLEDDIFGGELDDFSFDDSGFDFDDNEDIKI